MMHQARVAGALMRASLQTAVQYRSDFLLGLVSGQIRTVASILPIALVYGQVDTVMGWSAADCLAVMSLYLGVHAILGGLVEPNLGAVVSAVRDGSLDLVLLKPADSQLLVSVRRVEVSALWDLGAALFLMLWAFRMQGAPTPLNAGIAAWLALCGLVALYALWLAAICASFFFVRVDNLRYLLWSVLDAGRWPLPVFATPVRLALTYLVPVGIATTFPALALRGDWSYTLLLSGTLTAATFLVGSRLLWTWSLSRYTSASS